MRRVFLVLLLVLSSFFPIFSVFGSGGGYEVIFHNVGQGNAVCLISPRGQVLFIDAGSSSTRGITGIVDGGDDKYARLASKIVSNIKPKLEVSGWLGFIISHPDKDHLNLVSQIITQSGLPREHVGVLFGGKSQMYTKGDAEDLLAFLKARGISYGFAADIYELEADTVERPGLFYVLKSGVSSSFFLSSFEGIPGLQMISIDADVARGRRGKEDPNSVSIVLRLACGSSSFMLTGDKTVKESNQIVGRFKGYEGLLHSDVLLATHHGSSDDFCEEWVKTVNPKQIVFSSGRASFLHPRSEAIAGYCSKAPILEAHNWHELQFYGDSLNSSRFRTVAIEEHAGDRAEGYSHAITNLAVFGTATNGNIIYRIDGGPLTPTTEIPMGPDPRNVLYPFLSSPQMLDGTPLVLQAINLGGIRFPDGAPINLEALMPGLVGATTVRSLDLSDCMIGNIHVPHLVRLLGERENIRELNLSGGAFSAESNEALRKAWNSRGLTLPDPV